MQARLELIVFDLAGTTVADNHDVARILKDTMAYYGVNITLENATTVMGIPKPEAIKILMQYDQERQMLNDRQVVDIHKHFVQRMEAFYKNDPGVVEKEGASYVFAQLGRAGIKVAVDTGFDRAITETLLERMGWLKKNLVAASVTSDEVKNGRPHPDMIFKAMQLTGISDVTRVAKVGDTASDLQEGMAAGCSLVVGVTTGAYSREDLSRYPHHHLIDRLIDLLPLIGL